MRDRFPGSAFRLSCSTLLGVRHNPTFVPTPYRAPGCHRAWDRLELTRFAPSSSMPVITPSAILQVILGLGLLNVWILRASSATSYRGGSATSLREEFEAYGLPTWTFYLVGLLKVSCAGMLLAGLWFPESIVPAAAVIALLMVGALAMHAKVKDPAIRSLPAFLMLAMSASLVALSFG